MKLPRASVRTPRHLWRALPVSAALSLMLGASGVQAQSLVELFDAAQSYDAGFVAAKSQFEANL